jgi:Flp pilus assembly protein TadD
MPVPPAEQRPARPPDREPALPPPPQPEADPRAEHARLLRLGKESFARQEYGWAAHRFRQAIPLRPGDAEAQFLLAQALFAQGQYVEAREAIHAGMRLRPDWPTAPFRPLDLYGAGAAADYTDHLRTLEETLERNPNDPVLLFLYGYQLWFDGREAEAVNVFQRAARVTADKTFIERFLGAAKPAGNGVL